MKMLADLLSPIYLDTPVLLACSLLTLAAIILIEATVFRLLGWASWKMSFLHALIVNAATSLVGTGLFVFAKAENLAYAIPFPAILIGAFVLTVIIEAMELKALRLSAGLGRVALNSLIANILSYIFLCGMIYLALFPPVLGYSGGHRPYRIPTPAWSPTPSPSPGD
jgi:hypothetical protein